MHRVPLNIYDRYQVIPGLGYRDAGLSVLLFDRVRKEKPGETPTDRDYVNAYFDTRPEVYEDRESVQTYLFRTFQNFMELFGMVTTDWRFDREKHESFLLIYPTPTLRQDGLYRRGGTTLPAGRLRRCARVPRDAEDPE